MLAWEKLFHGLKAICGTNSGIPEAAVAGALGIQLGGTNSYGGKISERAKMGYPYREIEAEDIRRTTHILFKTVLYTLMLLILWVGYERGWL